MSFELLDCQCGKKRHNVDRIVGGNDAIVSYSYKKNTNISNICIPTKSAIFF